MSTIGSVYMYYRYAIVTLTLFMFTVHSVRNKAAYFAERLYKSMKVYSLSQCRMFESNLPTVRPLQMEMFRCCC